MPPLTDDSDHGIALLRRCETPGASGRGAPARTPYNQAPVKEIDVLEDDGGATAVAVWLKSEEISTSRAISRQLTSRCAVKHSSMMFASVKVQNISLSTARCIACV